MATTDPKSYWGYLFNPDRSPTELLDALLTGIAIYININIEPRAYDSLVPGKLAWFYRSVGGNYDPLFIETEHPSISFIYQALGCAHSLQQPVGNDFAPPSVPALLTRGFIRWESIQLLLGPEEHATFLQEAVRRFDIVDPRSGKLFPKILPREAFPVKPDEEMVKWHDVVMDRLRREAQNEQEAEEGEGLDDTEASMDGKPERQTDEDYFSYYTETQRPTERGGGGGKEEGENPTGTPPAQDYKEWRSRELRNGHRNVRPRRRSYPEEYIFPGNRSEQQQHRRDSPSPSSQNRRRRRESFDDNFPSPGTETTSTTSAAATTSGSESGTEDNTSEAGSSLTPGSTSSPSPQQQSTSSSHREPPLSSSSRRSHHPPTTTTYDISPIHTPSHHRHHHRTHSGDYYSAPRSPPTTYDIRIPAQIISNNNPAPPPPIPSSSYFHLRPPGGPPRANYRGANVRWSNESSLYTFPVSPSTPGSEGSYESSSSPPPPPRMISSSSGSSAARYALPERRVVVRSAAADDDDRNRDRDGRRRPQIRRLYSPLVGVDGRRYPTEGVVWR